MSNYRSIRSSDPGAGFTLIELLVVVAVIGIISAMATANFLNALDKSKQKKTMSDLRTIGTAVEIYAIDNATYPKSLSNWSGLRGILSPAHLRTPPDIDGWGLTWDVDTAADGSDYTLSSIGKDGLIGSRSGGSTSDFDCDVVFVNGSFFQWPEGMQS